jgi:uncharacterized protein (TIGR02145 family)
MGRSWCYGREIDNCTKYGRLYTWAAAMDSAGKWSTHGKNCGYNKSCTPTYPVRGICPEGWHIPSKSEFQTLFTEVKGQSSAGKVLKSASGWNGTDEFGFSALPGGYRHGSFYSEGEKTFFWSATAYSDIDSYYILFRSDDNAAPLGYDDKYYGAYIRCLKDEQ